MSNENDNDLEPLFNSAERAIKFALTFEGRPERPAMNRSYVSPISDGIKQAGSRLSGLDGAAQAGIIRTKMRALGKTADAILIARSAPRTVRCHGCGCDTKRHPVWQSAINYLTDEVGPMLKSRGYVVRELRELLVMRAFGESILLKDIGDKFELDEKTMTAYNGKVTRWLKGQKANHHSDAMEGVENAAWRDIESALTDCGIVG